MKKILSFALTLTMLTAICSGCLSGGPSAAPGSSTAAESSSTPAVSESSQMAADAIGLKLSTTMKQLELTTVPNGMGIKAMDDGLRAKSNGALYVDMYLDGVLGSSADELIGGAQNGAFDMIALAFGSWGDYTDAFAPLSIPYLFTSTEQLYQFIDGKVGNEIKAKVEQDTGMVVLAFLDVGFRNVTNNRKPIVTPADMKGLKIRTLNDRYQIAAMEALGASTQQISFSELYSALQQKLVDAQENPIINTYTSKFYEVQKYMTLTRHNYTFTILAVSRTALNRLTPEQQQLVIDMGKVAQDTCRSQLAAREAEILKELNQKMEVYDPTVEELQKFQEVAKTSWAQIEADMGSEKFNHYVDTANQISASLK
ncbi:MAG TPA: TRAP transporter substrate-binding protein [Clostridia bacterium]|nr:TRAP transporter substrate-binding protein [Clostridia bacterium]